MPRFYFDLHDSAWSRDDVGTECAALDEAIAQTKRALAEIVLDRLPREGVRHTVTMHVSDEDRQSVYTAVMSFSGLTHGR